jgi:hypothetical protein
LSDIAHPSVGIVILFAHGVRYLQVLYLQSGNIVHWDFKVHGYWTDLLATLGGVTCLETDFSDQSMLNTTLELIDCPVGTLLL